MFSNLSTTIRILVLQYNFNFDLSKHQRDKNIIWYQIILFLSKMRVMRIRYLAIKFFFPHQIQNTVEKLKASLRWAGELSPMCCTITVSSLYNQPEIWLWCLRIKTFRWIIFSNGGYSFSFQGGKSKLSVFMLACGKRKTRVSRWLCHVPFQCRESAVQKWKLKVNSS